MSKYEYRKIDDSYCVFLVNKKNDDEIQIGVVFTEVHAKIIVRMLNDYHSNFSEKGE